VFFGFPVGLFFASSLLTHVSNHAEKWHEHQGHERLELHE
jgi:hypothetical protein